MIESSQKAFTVSAQLYMQVPSEIVQGLISDIHHSGHLDKKPGHSTFDMPQGVPVMSKGEGSTEFEFEFEFSK